MHFPAEEAGAERSSSSSLQRKALLVCEGLRACTIGAFIITYTTLGVPDYNYSIMGPKTLF